MAKKETLNYLPPGMTIASTDKSREVLCMCWEHQSTDKVYKYTVEYPNGLLEFTVRNTSCTWDSEVDRWNASIVRRNTSWQNATSQVEWASTWAWESMKSKF